MIKSVKDFIELFRGKKKERFQIINLQHYDNIKFKITCEIERYRVEKFGGEQEALDYFLKLSRESSVIFDIGASVGLYSVITAKMNPNATVYSFEPDPETFSRLNENASLNKLINITTFDLACSDKEEKSMLFSDGINGFAPSLAKQNDRKGAPEHGIMIKSDTIDRIIKNFQLPIPDLLKIDIEGAEILFLKGSIELLRGNLGKKPNSIFIEVHPAFLKDFNSSTDEVQTIFKEYGYEVVWERKREDQIHCHYKIK